MNVAELIEELRECPPDAPVWVEDSCCGCVNAADHVMYVEDNPDGAPFVAVSG